MTDPNDKGAGAGDEESKVALTVDGETVEKTMDELKELATGALSDKDETYALKIDGEDKSFTLDELKQQASEAAGAQKKFEEAHSIKEKAATGTRIQELLADMKKDSAPSEAKATELLRLMGADEASMKELMAGVKGVGDPKDKAGKPDPITLDKLDLRVRAAVEAAEQMDLQQLREKIEGEAKKGVDNDKILGKIIDETSEGEQQGKLKEVLYNMMIDDVRGRILAREAYGPEMIQSSLQKVRARIQTLGIPTAATGQPPLTGELGAAAALAPEIRATEPIKRVSSADPGYEENAIKRFQQKMVGAAKKMGK